MPCWHLCKVLGIQREISSRFLEGMEFRLMLLDLTFCMKNHFCVREWPSPKEGGLLILFEGMAMKVTI